MFSFINIVIQYDPTAYSYIQYILHYKHIQYTQDVCVCVCVCVSAIVYKSISKQDVFT